MVSAKKITGKDGPGYAKYLSGVSAGKGDYYVAPDGSPGEVAGVWMGMSEEELAEIGIDPEFGVAGEQLEGLMAGLNPETGEELRRVGGDGSRVAGIDTTFSVPKTVSAVWATSDPELRAAIEAEFYGAVAEGIDYIGHELLIVRETHNGANLHVKAAGVAAAVFMHSASRLTGAEEDGIPDPQLHMHVLLLGAKRQDGTFAAIDSYAIFQAQHELDGRVMASFFARLEHNLGMEVERTVDAKGRVKVELAGVSPELIAAWSRRTADIDVAKAAFRAEHHKAPTAKQIKVMVLATRGTKTHLSRGDLFAAWKAKAAQFGGAAWRRAKRSSAAERALQFQAELIHYLTTEHAIADSRRLGILAAGLAKGLLSAQKLDEQLELMKLSGELVALADGRWTTKTIRALEVEAMAAAGRLAARKGVPMSEQALDAAKAAVEGEKGLALSAEQRAALRSITAEGGLKVLIGQAGTGKGFAMAVAVRAWQAQGLEVIGAAVAGKRAVALESEWGIGKVMNLAQMVKSLEVGALKLTPRNVIVVDEAGMVSHPQMAAALAAADKAGAKLVLVGDHAQLQAISAGGLFRSVARVAPTVELTEVRRAKEVWERAAQTAVREGRTVEALAAYGSHGRLHLVDTREEAQAAMVKAWNEARKGLAPGEALMIVDSSNNDRDALNLIAQSYKAEAGELGEARAKVGKSAEVYAHVGDRVMVGKKTDLGPRQKKIENGTLAEVTGVDPATGALTLRTEEAEPRTVRLAGDQLLTLELADACHVYKVQGDDITRSFVSIGGWQTDAPRAYTALSRSTDQTDIFLAREDLDEEGIGSGNVDAALAEAAKRMRKSGTKEASIEHEVVPYVAAAGQARQTVAVRPAAIDHHERARVQDVEHHRRGGVRKAMVRRTSLLTKLEAGVGGLLRVEPREAEAVTVEPVVGLRRVEPRTAPVTPTVTPTVTPEPEGGGLRRVEPRTAPAKPQVERRRVERRRGTSNTTGGNKT